MTQTNPAPVSSTTPDGEKRRSFVALYVILGVLVLAAATYGFAWYRAYRLSTVFVENAAESFDEGEYLNALTGYEEFDEAENRYIYRGGYGQVALIWADPYAWPRPELLGEARARTEEIISERLTLDDAEAFIEENIGQQNPYLGRIYLRTGELYEEEGDADDAMDVYEEVIDAFPNNAALVERATAHLERLEAAEEEE
jgi:tetratricopeptide (TPR) repeat protein